jgi:small subunit ribosomal protein S5
VQDEGRDDGLREKMIAVNRVTKVVKGGRILGFAALTVVGDGDGRVGMGKGKSKEVPAAVQKAMEECRRNLMKVALKNGTIHHSVKGHHGAAKVDDAPSSQGYRHHRWRPDARCFRSGGYHRHRGQEPRFVEPLQHGSRHFRRFEELHDPCEVAAKRGKSVEDIFTA